MDADRPTDGIRGDTFEGDDVETHLLVQKL